MDTLDDLKQAAQDFVCQLVEADLASVRRRFDSKLIQTFLEAKVIQDIARWIKQSPGS